tara:strand:+ start:1786 stop:1890 length:105 start_codon:yes stop_codon:yes gene_type:complete
MIKRESLRLKPPFVKSETGGLTQAELKRGLSLLK